MAEVSKADIERIHERMDDIARDTRNQFAETNKSIRNVEVSVTKLTTILDERPRHDTPCGTLAEHLAEHKADTRIWKNTMVTTIIKIILGASVLGASGGAVISALR